MKRVCRCRFAGVRAAVAASIALQNLFTQIVLTAGLAACGGGGREQPVETPPQITTNPSSVHATPGTTATFAAVFSANSGALQWQWFRDGTPVEGATEPTLQITGVGCSDSGAAFAVQATNRAGTSTSQAALLTVAPCPGIALVAGALGGYGNRNDVGEWARFRPIRDIAADRAGNVYTTDSDSGTIRRISPTGVVSVFAGSSTSPNGIDADRTGDLYAAWADHTIVKLAADGTPTAIAGASGQHGYVDGGSAQARFFAPEDVAVDAAGNVYVADTYNSVIRKIASTGQVSTLAGSGEWRFQDGVGRSAGFVLPSRLAVDPAGNVYVLERSNCIRKISAEGVVTSIKVGEECTSTLDPRIPASSLSAIAIEKAGNILVGKNQTIVSIAPGGTQETLLDLSGSGRDAIAGLALGVDGTIFFATSSHVGRLAADRSVRAVAGASEQPGSADGGAAQARFNRPAGTAVDAAGNIYVADAGSSTLRKIARDGTVTTIAGLAGVPGSVDGTGSAARFRSLTSIAVDRGGTIYIADQSDHTIRKVSPQGEVSTLAGLAGAAGFADGPGHLARFFRPYGLAVDMDGFVYVAERGCDKWELTLDGGPGCARAGQTIRRISPSGYVSTLAGAPFQYGNEDGVGANASFYLPSALAVDAAGNVFVGDSGNNLIRKIAPTGQVSTVSRTAWNFPASDQFGNRICSGDSSSMALDAAGNILLTACNLIRRIAPDGTATTIVGEVGVTGVRVGALPGGLNQPRGISVDRTGALYVADENSVLKIVLTD